MTGSLLGIHKIVVLLFLIIYLIKTILLLANKNESLARFTKVIKVPEMIISSLFLVTGVWMMVEIGAVKTLQIIKLVAIFIAIPLAVIGFKRSNKALGVISLLLIIAAYGLAEASKKKPYPVKTDKQEIGSEDEEVNGQNIYLGKGNCVSCHGADGKKRLAGATDLSISQLDKNGIENVVVNGRNSMAPYKDILSAEEISAVTEYVESLKK